jgi:hypothetical protein
MKKILSYGLLLATTVCLTGCSISFQFYVRNFTDDKIFVLKIFSNSKTSLTDKVSDYVLFKNKILEMNSKTWSNTTDTLKTTIKGDTLIVKILPKTTVKLPYFRADYEEIGKLKVDGLLTFESRTIDTFTIYPSKPTEKIKRKSGFFQIIDYYDIEPNAR